MFQISEFPVVSDQTGNWRPAADGFFIIPVYKQNYFLFQTLKKDENFSGIVPDGKILPAAMSTSGTSLD